MLIQRTHQNELCSAGAFKTLAVDTVRKLSKEGRKFRLTDHAIRHLQVTMILTVEGKQHLPEALTAILSAVTAKMKSNKATTHIEIADVEDWLVNDDEVEWVGDGQLKERPLYSVRRLLDRKRVEGVTYYLVDWEPTWETRADVGNTLIVKFEKARRALVRRTYIEDEAEEASQ